MNKIFPLFLIVFFTSLNFGHTQSNGTSSNGVQQTQTATLKWRDWVKDKSTTQSDLNKELLRLEGIDTYETLAMRGFIYIYKETMDEEKAFNFSLRAAEEASNALGEYNMGKIYGSGFGVEKNLEKAVQWYQKSAENGDVYAQGNLAFAYLNGEGISKNLGKARHWAEKAADQGSAVAMNTLGVTYVKEGIDYFEAAYWYRKAAELGNATSQNNLGWLYYEGNGVNKDLGKAAYWFKKAANLNHASSQNKLGMMYKLGEGVQKDYNEAVKWFGKAAENGNLSGKMNKEMIAAESGDAKAMYNLGVLYYDAKGNYKTAAYWFEKAARLDYVPAQNKYGEMYKSGQGVQKDYNEAMKWFRKAAEEGNSYGQRNMGSMYDEGLGMDKPDWNKARFWYKNAADQGNSNAQLNMGEFYYFGVGGVSKDITEAIKWFEKSAANNNSTAKIYLDVIEDINKMNGKKHFSDTNKFNDQIKVTYSYTEPVIFSSVGKSWNEEVSFTLGNSSEMKIWPSSRAVYGFYQKDEIYFTSFSNSKSFTDNGEKVVSISSNKPVRSIGYMYVVASVEEGRVGSIDIKLPIALCWLPE